MPHNFEWITKGCLAGIGRPGCGLELAGEMLPHERRFLSWLWFSPSLSSDRQKLAKRIGIQASSALQLDQRMLDLYKKFRDIWGILAGYREGFGSDGGSLDRFDLSTKRLEADLSFLQEQGIHTLVSLTETPLDGETLSAMGFEVLHLPIPDRKAPTPDQIDQFVEYIDERLLENKPVGVHCLGGYGRTGTMLTCYLVYCGQPAQMALQDVREKRPGSVESDEQEQAIVEYEERIK